jgi:hypothetical protein
MTVVTHERWSVIARRLREAHSLRDVVETETGQAGQKQGSWTLYFCPFHANSHTRALGVGPDDTHWKCFAGCGAGDVVDFIARLYQESVVEASRRLGMEPDPAAVAARRASREREQERERAKQRAKRAWLESEQPWKRYHANLEHEPRAQAWWQARGVRRDWQVYWWLGYNPDLYATPDHGGLGPASVIPYFDLAGHVRTLQHRLWNAEGTSKYRFEGGLGDAVWIARPDMGVKDQEVVVVEGAIKGMVTHVLGVHAERQVIAFPAKASDGDVGDLLAAARRVWLIPDPDTWKRPKTAGSAWEPPVLTQARNLGNKAFIITLEAKIDDELLAGRLTPEQLAWYLANAMPSLHFLRRGKIAS